LPDGERFAPTPSISFGSWELCPQISALYFWSKDFNTPYPYVTSTKSFLAIKRVIRATTTHPAAIETALVNAT